VGRLHAERELGQLLSTDPRHALAHALMAQAMLGQLRLNDAEYAAREAISSAPDEAFAHYAMSAVLRERRRFAEAVAAIQQAIALDPYSPNQFALLAQLRVDQREFSAALVAYYAAAVVQGALDKDPENAVTHANQGWTLLHRNDPKQALEHFREALRLDPTNDWARAGIVEAMKARNPIYRVILAYFLWMSRLSGQVQTAIVLGGWFGQRVLRQAAQSNPALQPYVLPIILAYALFVFVLGVAASEAIRRRGDAHEPARTPTECARGVRSPPGRAVQRPRHR
jgi:tetratricopeptide (TPR) repeat protein